MKTITTKYRTFGLVAIVAILTVSMVAMALSQSAVAAPANKTSIGETELSILPDTADWVTIVKGTIKTSTPSDLIVSHNQECAIHTGLNLDDSFEVGTSSIREDVRLLVDGKIVPATFGDPITGDGLDGEGQITMCGRAYHIDTNVLSTLLGLCKAFEGGGGDFVCPDTVFFESYIRTKQAHSWDWVVLNVGSGVHDVEVQAKLVKELEGMKTGSEKAKGKATDSGPACADGDPPEDCVDTILEVGKRNLIIVEDKLATFQTLK